MKTVSGKWWTRSWPGTLLKVRKKGKTGACTWDLCTNHLFFLIFPVLILFRIFPPCLNNPGINNAGLGLSPCLFGGHSPPYDIVVADNCPCPLRLCAFARGEKYLHFDKHWLFYRLNCSKISRHFFRLILPVAFFGKDLTNSIFEGSLYFGSFPAQLSRISPGLQSPF